MEAIQEIKDIQDGYNKHICKINDTHIEYLGSFKASGIMDTWIINGVNIYIPRFKGVMFPLIASSTMNSMITLCNVSNTELLFSN